jgi:phosphonate transport system substrate-binding protein
MKTKTTLSYRKKSVNLLLLDIKDPRPLLCFLAALSMIFVHGCSQENDTVVVDFSKTVAVERPGDRSSEHKFLRVAVGAMISPKETFIYYNQLLNYISDKLGLEVQLIQRKTYSEINELLGKGQIDLAFICSGPYVKGKEKYSFELLATPQVRGSNFYQSYLIVNKDSHFYKLDDLRDRVFAFTDPESNTGKLVPAYWLSQMGETPESFFEKTIYTYSHDNSIMAVSKSLVDGAAVDSLIWEFYNNKNPVFTSRTRIIKKSEPYGIPPLVASRYLSQELKDRISLMFLTLHKEDEGQRILDELMIDRFTAPREEWYNSIRQIIQGFSTIGESADALKKP